MDQKVRTFSILFIHSRCIYCLKALFRKIFLIKSYDVASECIAFFDCFVSDAIYKRKLKFLTKLQHSENTICKLFEKYIIDELDIVHGHLLS